MHVQLVVHSLLCTLLVQFGRNSGLWRRFHVWRYVRCYVVLIMIKLWTYLLSLVKVAFRPVRIDFYLENPPSPSHSHISVTYESSSYSYFVLLRGVGRNCFIYYLKSETNWDSGVILHFNNNGEVMLIKIQADATICRYLFTAKLLYMFRVSEHSSSGVLKTVTAASGTGHNTGAATSLQRGLIGTASRSGHVGGK